MTTDNRLSGMDLAALIGSRICHDLISPIGAIANGLEVLAGDPDEEMRKVAFTLIENSARQASGKLQFARLAFGAAGSAGAEISLGDAGDLARNLVRDDKRLRLDWRAPSENRPKPEVKLVLNLFTIATTCIPRGGDITVDADAGSMTIAARGTRACLPQKTAEVLTGAIPATRIGAHEIQPYYTLRLIEQTGHALQIDQGEDEVVLNATR